MLGACSGNFLLIDIENLSNYCPVSNLSLSLCWWDIKGKTIQQVEVKQLWRYLESLDALDS